MGKPWSKELKTDSFEFKPCPSCKMLINRTAKVCPNCRRKFGLREPKTFIPLLILGAVVFIGGYTSCLGRSDKDTAEKAKDILEKGMALASLDVLRSNWRRDGFETVAIWEVTFFNKGDRPVGNIKYKTAYYAETGDTVDRGGGEQKTIRKVIMPRQKRTIIINDGFVPHEAHRASFKMVSCEFVNPQ